MESPEPNRRWALDHCDPNESKDIRQTRPVSFAQFVSENSRECRWREQ
jgi:hypothetical protein